MFEIDDGDVLGRLLMYLSTFSWNFFVDNYERLDRFVFLGISDNVCLEQIERFDNVDMDV